MYIPTREVNIFICQINKPRWLAVLYNKFLYFHFGLNDVSLVKFGSAGFYSLYIQTNIDDNKKKLKVPL